MTRTATDPLDDLLPRLNELSVEHGHGAFTDVGWDDPALAIDHDDPRWEALDLDPLAASAWYRAQPPAVRREIGILRIASIMRVGWQFENVLQRGLLELAMRMPNGTTEFRYAHHEIIEESQHTLMFQEFVDRAGAPATGMPRWAVRAGDRIARRTRWSPALFFLFVLGGEAPIDHVQRRVLREERLHPLVHRIFDIHVAEEARHLSYAKTSLRRDVGRMGPLRRHALALLAPFVFAIMARMILAPTPALVSVHGMPRREFRALRRSTPTAAFIRDALGPTRRFLRSIGLVTPASVRVWRALGVWDDGRG
ncbi:MAG: diiron oxygenase [Actinobacteria bacterium]|nr:diiron oxygenase [Actinomycetota bacterium]